MDYYHPMTSLSMARRSIRTIVPDSKFFVNHPYHSQNMIDCHPQTIFSPSSSCCTESLRMRQDALIAEALLGPFSLPNGSIDTVLER